MRTTLPLLLFWLISLSGCNILQYEKSKEDLHASTHPSPSHCLVRASVVKIKKEMSSDSSLCSKISCYATIEVKEVIAYGPGFNPTLSSGEKIEARFVFGLSKTNPDLFPQLKKTYPGLKEGNIFEADMESRLPINDQPSYIIYDYTLK